MYDRVHGMSEHPGLILKALYNRCPAVSRRLVLSAAARNGTGHSGAQFNVNRVTGARIALGFVLMLTTGNIEDLRLFTSSPRVILFRKPVRRSLRSRHSA